MNREEKTKKKKKITLWKILQWTIFFPIKLIFLALKLLNKLFGSGDISKL